MNCRVIMGLFTFHSAVHTSSGCLSVGTISPSLGAGLLLRFVSRTAGNRGLTLPAPPPRHCAASYCLRHSDPCGIPGVCILFWLKGVLAVPGMIPPAGAARVPPPRPAAICQVNATTWSLALAYNLGSRHATGQHLLKLDCDTHLDDRFFDKHAIAPGMYFSGNWKRARNDNEVHLNGILFLRLHPSRHSPSPVRSVRLGGVVARAPLAAQSPGTARRRIRHPQCMVWGSFIKGVPEGVPAFGAAVTSEGGPPRLRRHAKNPLNRSGRRPLSVTCQPAALGLPAVPRPYPQCHVLLHATRWEGRRTL